MATILVVDDFKDIREYLKILLESRNHFVIPASNGKEAVKIYKEYRADIVITDLYMPVMDGETTIFELRKINPEVPIIAISGGGKICAEDHLKLVEYLGIKYVFAKPIDKSGLLKAVDEILEKEKI